MLLCLLPMAVFHIPRTGLNFSLIDLSFYKGCIIKLIKGKSQAMQYVPKVKLFRGISTAFIIIDKHKFGYWVSFNPLTRVIKITLIQKVIIRQHVKDQVNVFTKNNNCFFFSVFLQCIDIPRRFVRARVHFRNSV